MKARELFYGFLFGVFLVLALANNLSADTPVSGFIFTDTTWTLAGSPYIVVDDVFVDSSATLTVEPGVEVRFENTNAIMVDGTAVAIGTNGNEIVFTANSEGENWGYILFRDSSTDAIYDLAGDYTGGSILEYCIIEYAGGASVTNNGALRMHNAHPCINYCTIRNNSASGIYAWDLSGFLKITNNNVSNNAAYGITVSGGNDAISMNTVSHNEGGVLLTNLSNNTVQISHNTIFDNSTSERGGGIGIGPWSMSNNNIEVSNNTISNNSAAIGGGIYLGDLILSDVSVHNNYVKNNSASSAGGGIFFSRGRVTILNNVISNNIAATDGGGIYVGYNDNGGNIFHILSNIINNNIATSGYGAGIYRARTDGLYPSVSRNVICGNSANSDGGGYYGIYDSAPGYANLTTVFSHNALIANRSRDMAVAIRYYSSKDFRYNTIVRNMATIGVASRSICIEGTPLLNYNNIFGNSATYELWNNNGQGSADVNAMNNWWGTDIPSEIEDKIYHWIDDSSKGLVDYYPFDAGIRTDTPISPPTELLVSTTDSEIILSWDANPEGDIGGYKVYWGTEAAPFFENVVDVSNSLGHTITGLAADTYYVGVTAYDNDYNPANDDPNTIVNENQTNGNESWYTNTIAIVGEPEPRTLALVDPNGGESLLVGKSFTIAWQSTGRISNLLIEYSTDNGSNWVPIGTVMNTGSCQWVVPSVTSDQCLVAITDPTNFAITDTSDDVFTIFVCQGSFAGDMNADCYVNWVDFPIFADEWLKCGNPFDPNCGY